MSSALAAVIIVVCFAVVALAIIAGVTVYNVVRYLRRYYPDHDHPHTHPHRHDITSTSRSE